MTLLTRLLSLGFLLSMLGCSKPTAYWMEQVKASDPIQRVQAVHELQARLHEGTAIVPALVGALQDENTHVRRDAARALGKFGVQAREAIPALQARLRDAEPSVRKAAALSLKQMDLATVP